MKVEDALQNQRPGGRVVTNRCSDALKLLESIGPPQTVLQLKSFYFFKADITFYILH